MPGVKLADGVKFQDGETTGSLFETKSEKVYTLNPVACSVIRQIIKRSLQDPAAVIANLKNDFEDPDNKIVVETTIFLGQLKEAGLLEVHS